MAVSMEVWRGAEKLRAHLRPIGDLRPHPGNSRRGDVPAIAQSLKRFGQVRPVLALEDGTIIAGHHVTRAAQLLGWTHVAAIAAEFDTRADAADYLVADNQLSTLGFVEPADQLSFLEEIERRGSWDGTGYSAEDLEDVRALSQLKSERVRLDELKAHPDNYRSHPESQIEHLTASLKEHGIYRNIVIASDGTVLAGHGIVEAARRMGINKIPVTRLAVGPNSPEALKVIAGDNELAKLGEVDDRQLTELLRHVSDSGDVSALVGTGFDARTLAGLVLISRPESEIKDFDAAAEWVGMPGFEATGARISLVVAFDDEAGREALIEQLGIFIAKKTRQTWSAWWPPREQEDLSSLRFGGERVDSIEETPEGPRTASVAPVVCGICSGPMEDAGYCIACWEGQYGEEEGVPV